MNAHIDLYREVEYIVKMSSEELENYSIIELNEFKKQLKNVYKRIKIDRERFDKKKSFYKNSGETMSDLMEKIKEINIILKTLPEKEDNTKITYSNNKRDFTLQQKFQILRKMGYIELIIEKFDDKLQHEIFSELFNCAIDTSRKIHTGTYKETSDVRPNEYKELLRKINKK